MGSGTGDPAFGERLGSGGWTRVERDNGTGSCCPVQTPTDAEFGVIVATASQSVREASTTEA